MISKLTDESLLQATKLKVETEKELTLEILFHLAEIEKRRLYLKLGFPSLFEYCVQELGYSEGASFRRISAMRLTADVPEAKTKLKEGTVNVSTLSQLQRFIRKEEKFTGQRMSPSEKLELLAVVEHKSQQEVEREFARISPHIAMATEKKRVINEDLTEVKAVFSEEVLNKLEKLKNFLSHKNPNPSFAELIEMLADLALKRLDPEMKKSGVQKTPQRKGNKEKTPNPNVPPNAGVSSSGFQKNFSRRNHLLGESRYIPSAYRQEVWMKYRGICNYKDQKTGKRCGSKHLIQFDHVIPISRGGKTELKNLQLLCASHNQLKSNHLRSESGSSQNETVSSSI